MIRHYKSYNARNEWMLGAISQRQQLLLRLCIQLRASIARRHCRPQHQCEYISITAISSSSSIRAVQQLDDDNTDGVLQCWVLARDYVSGHGCLRPNEAKMATDEWRVNSVFRSVFTALTTMLVLSRSVCGRWSLILTCDR